MPQTNVKLHGPLGGKALTSDRRSTPRFRMRFRTFLTDQHSVIEHFGTVRDLSMAGCRAEATVPVQQSAVMELRIYVPDLD
jgi:hypothetical protein